jgi:hypothetical protein
MAQPEAILLYRSNGSGVVVEDFHSNPSLGKLLAAAFLAIRI